MGEHGRGAYQRFFKGNITMDLARKPGIKPNRKPAMEHDDQAFQPHNEAWGHKPGRKPLPTKYQAEHPESDSGAPVSHWRMMSGALAHHLAAQDGVSVDMQLTPGQSPALLATLIAASGQMQSHAFGDRMSGMLPTM
jgi:hypothetical protein